jgi:hypothetical protein
MLNPSITTADLIARVFAAAKARSFWTPSPDAGSAYDLFLFGVRDVSNPDTWNDALGCIYRTAQNGPLQLQLWRGTTDPGRPALVSPGNPAGTAVFAPGQQRAVWTLGTHKGRPAFVQNRPILVLRDNDRDGIIDPTAPAVAGFYGINGHDAYRDGLTTIGEASEGCIVWWDGDDHDEVLKLAQAQEKALKVLTFSFTLFDIRDCPTLAPLLSIVRDGVSA